MRIIIITHYINFKEQQILLFSPIISLQGQPKLPLDYTMSAQRRTQCVMRPNLSVKGTNKMPLFIIISGQNKNNDIIPFHICGRKIK